MPNMATRFIYHSLRVLRWHRLIPASRWGDRLYAHLLCLYFNGYWPRRERRAQYDPGFEQRRGERLFGPQGFNLADFPEL